jgi:alpha-1,6-mannosyltransferase
MPSATSPISKVELRHLPRVKVCDLTQFYSPVSGGVKRYVQEKVRHVQRHLPQDSHILIIPGGADSVETGERSRIYTIKSPLISRTSRYRILLRLERVEQILCEERPDIIEAGDPYQVAWKAIASGAALRIPAVGFYHSHFPEAYLRSVAKFLGRTATEYAMDFARRYVRKLYNRFARTLVPSPALGALLAGWGVENVENIDLGVDTAIFSPSPEDGHATRAELGVPADRFTLLYVGRLAHEKNTHTLFEAFRIVNRFHPDRFHLIVVGDGLQRAELEALREELSATEVPGPITWLPYCADAARLAALYRAADLFVHPGVQETFGLVALESQACGTPVVGVRGSYMDRIIYNDQQFWARENTPAALAAAILESSCGKDRAEIMELSRSIAARYSWDRVFSHLFDVYRAVAEGYRNPR